MVYQEFLNYIKDNLVDYMKDRLKSKEDDSRFEEHAYEVELHKVVKNNGIVLDGIAIRIDGANISPNIYLNSYYENYQMGRPVTSIMEEIVYLYEQAKEESDIDIVDILDYKTAKNKIFIRLVNYERNKEQLEQCPHKRYLDLAITFRYIASKDSCGLASSLISNQEFENWNVDLEELYQIALFNTMREFPWRMDSLAKVVTECFRSKMSDELPEELLQELAFLEERECGVNMFVLTNETGVNGATCILYENVIMQFAKVQESNVFILPSSIHEVMLVPESEETDAELLSSLVREANQSAVGLIDLLSDYIYYYDLDKNEITLYEER